jgi:hypothetical protein
MPPSRLASAVFAAALWATLAGSIPAQATPATNLGKANAKSKYTLGHLLALQELPDGRVVASDTKENAFRLIDLAKGDVSVLGKSGFDSDAYRTAQVVVP